MINVTDNDIFANMKKHVCYIGLLLLCALFGPGIVAAGEQIAMPDPALREAVADELELASDEAITTADLHELTSLRARGAGITDVTGLEAAVNLRELDLRDNDIAHVAPLSGLVSLEWLSLRENPRLADLSPLAGLENLEYLNINYSPSILSIQPLSGLQRLEVLLMREVRILHSSDEAAVLPQLGNLQRLNVRDTGLTSVEPLLPGLNDGVYDDQLDLQENPIRDAALLSPYRDELDISSAGPVLSGRLRAGGGLQYGFREWPESDAAGDQSVRDLAGGDVLYDMDARFAVDYHPSSTLRVYAQVSTEFDKQDMEFDLPEFRRLFGEYHLAGPGSNSSIRFRAGLQSMEWGSTLFHTNYADLVADVDDGIALRTDADFTLPQSFPLVGGAEHEFTGVIDGRRGFFTNPGNPSPRKFAYGLRYRVGVDLLRVGGGVRYQRDMPFPLQTLAKLRLRPGHAVDMLQGSELHAQASAYWLTDDLPNGDGFFTLSAAWQPPGTDWELAGEYQYVSRIIDGHFAAARLQTPAIPVVNIVPSLEWRHAVHDESGVLLPRLQRRLTPQLSAELSLPIVYGDTVSFYRQWNDRHNYLDLPPAESPRPAAIMLALQYELEW